MKKYLLFILALCAGFTAHAQMATTMKTNVNGQQRLVSNDHRDICFRTLAKRITADLNPATHGGPGMGVYLSEHKVDNQGNVISLDFGGFTNATETALNVLPYFDANGESATPDWGVNQETATYFGTESPADNKGYVDLTGYYALRIYNTHKGFRLYFHNQNGEIDKPIINQENACVTWNDKGYYVIDLGHADIPKTSDGKIHLCAIKGSAYNSTDVVTNITALKSTQHQANCSYSYDANTKVGTFAYSNVRTGNAAVNLFYDLKGKLYDQGNDEYYENFVIRTLNVTSPLKGQTIGIKDWGVDGDIRNIEQTGRFCLQFLDEQMNIIHELFFYSDDMKVIPLKEFFPGDQFDRINSVWISSAGGDVSVSSTVQIAEAYFTTAYNMNKVSTNFPKGEYFYDMDDKYVGNAYIHPSYFMMSNGLNFDTETGYVSIDPNVYTYNDLQKTMYSDVDNCMFRVGDETIGSTEGTDRYIYGNWSWNASPYTDLASYASMTVRYDQLKDAPRIVFNIDKGFGEDGLKEINPANIGDFADVVTVSNGVCTINIQSFISKYGDAHLNFIKAPDNGTALISSILLEKVEERGVADGQNNKEGRIQLSVPYSGFDMSEVTVVSMDNAEDGDLMGRWICGYLDYFRGWNVPDNQKNVRDGSKQEVFLADQNMNGHDIRTLYTSRYNGDFEPPVGDGTYNDYLEYKNKVNNIYWDTSNAVDRTKGMTLYDICITKNHVIARNGGNHSKLSKELFNNQGNCEINTSGGAGTTLYGDGGVGENNYADLSKFYKMQIKGTPKTEIRILSNTKGEDPNKSYRETFVRLDANGLANVDIAAYVKEDGEYKVNAIKVPWGGSATTIEYFKLYGEEDGIVQLNDELFHSWIRDENITVTREIARRSNFVNRQDADVAANEVIYGNDMILKENYAELTGYKTLRVYGTGITPALFYNCSSNVDDEAGQVVLTKTTPTATGDGYVDFDISNYVYFHLNAIVNFGGAGHVGKIELISDERVDYVLEGNGILSRTPEEALAERDGGTNAIPYGSCAIEAINDLGARVIDARPRVSISRTNLVYPGNPNLLFLTRQSLTKKQSARTQFNTPSTTTEHGATTDSPLYANMVTIGGLEDANYEINGNYTAFNIHLFDGYAFSAPRDIKYTNAKLTRKTTGGRIGTLILPFECADVKGDAYKTTYAEYAETASKVGKGILGDIKIDANDHVLLYELNEGNAAAYMPYLYVADETSDATVFNAVSNGTITKTPEVGPEEAPAEYMTNNYQDQKDRHYLRGFMESTHVENMYGYNSNGDLKRATKATMTPFRVMIQAPIDVNQDAAQQAAAGGVKILLAKFDENDEPTEIKVVDAAELEGIVDVYSVNGALIKKSVKAADAVNSLPKGVYVIGGKKIVK